MRASVVQGPYHEAVTLAPEVAQVLSERLRLMIQEREAAEGHPAELLRHTKAIDPKTGEEFLFHFDEGWEWQREELTAYQERPGAAAAESEAARGVLAGDRLLRLEVPAPPAPARSASRPTRRRRSKLVNRAWDLWENLPEHLRFDAKVIKPYKGRPSTRIEWEFPDGRSLSSLIAMPSSPRAGHGETAAVVFLDEFARHPYAAGVWKAFIPVIADGGQMHRRLHRQRVRQRVLRPVDERRGARGRHPLPRGRPAPGPRRSLVHADAQAAHRRGHGRAVPAERGRGVPRHRRLLVRHRGARPLRRERAGAGVHACRFQSPTRPARTRTIAKRRTAGSRSGTTPDKERTTRSTATRPPAGASDYTCAYVIDLSDMNIAAELHGKIDPDLAAEQTALPRPLVQHRPHRGRAGRWLRGRRSSSPSVTASAGASPIPSCTATSRTTGPTTSRTSPTGSRSPTKTRPLIINQLEQAIREQASRTSPCEAILECKTFVRHDTLPSPRAAEGTNDDRVMALAGALEMFRRYGYHPHDARSFRRRTARIRARLRLELRRPDA